MVARGLLPTFSEAALAEVRRIHASNGDAQGAGLAGIRDLTGLPSASIDNDTSRDLDQLTVAEGLAARAVRIRVAIADVDAVVTRGSALDAHARQNTSSVYTEAAIFRCCPGRFRPT